MTSRSRRRLLGGAVTLAGLSVGGCLGTIPSDFGSSTSTAESLALDTWVPKPGPTNGRKHYLLSDAVFWNHGLLRSFEDALHPEVYDRVTAVPDADRLGLSPSDIDARIDVASQSASIYLGEFGAETITSTVERKGLTRSREIGSYEVYTPGEEGYQRVVGVDDGVAVVGKGAGIQMAGDDDRTSDISPKTAVVNAIDARRSEEARYADTSDAFRSLVKSTDSLAGGTVKTFERISDPTPEQLQFVGSVGITHGFEFSRPKSVFVVTFLFSDPNEAFVDPIEEQFEQKPGLNEYEDVTYTTDGSTVTVRAKMANERFDGYLPGDPEDRV